MEKQDTTRQPKNTRENRLIHRRFHPEAIDDQPCIYCGTRHRLGECQYIEAELRR